MDKEKLDKIIKDYKVQPVGNGYIDLIVSRDLFKQFVHELIENGFVIKSVSWWEWCANKDECKYGLGGPESKFYRGWFAELPIDVDDIELSDLTTEKAIENVIDLIDSKSIQYPDEIISFHESNWLTPAIWLDVPDNWINKFN
ncbi:hypothetical protein [Allomuricauda sp. M10]|uniref:hypothetical protein n=1 Tax=Allomuricauda sp. M10 TaxID=2683292 RepID=UPI001D1847EA|nr:hypothetical protein [Muricauda sp. M10]